LGLNPNAEETFFVKDPTFFETVFETAFPFSLMLASLFTTLLGSLGMINFKEVAMAVGASANGFFSPF